MATNSMRRTLLENAVEPDTIRDEPEPKRLYRSGKPSPSNLKAMPGEDGVSYLDRLANPWPLPPGRQPVFPGGKDWHAIDPARLPSGSVVPTPPEGHWIVKDNPPEMIREAVVERGTFPD
jgi:hypothetical protein